MASAWHWLKVSPLPPSNDCAVSIDSSSTRDLSTSSDELEAKSISPSPKFFTVYFTPRENDASNNNCTGSENRANNEGLSGESNPNENDLLAVKSHIPIFPTSETSLGNVITDPHTTTKTAKLENITEATATNRSWIKAVKMYFSQNVVYNAVDAMQGEVLMEQGRKLQPKDVFVVPEHDGLEKEEGGLEVAQHDAPANQVEEIPKYLDHFFQFMYYLGLSTFDPSRDQTRPVKWMKTCCVFLQKILFYCISVLALFHSANLLKLNWLIFVEKGEIVNLVDVGFWLVPVMIEIYVIHLFAFKHEKAKQMLENLSTYCTGWLEASRMNPTTNSYGGKQTKKKVYRMITVLVVTSVLICLCKAGTNDGMQNWSLKQKTLTKSKDLGSRLFAWNTDDVFDTNRTQYFREKYGTHLTPLTIIMGVVMTIIEFFSYLKMEMIINLVIVTGYCLKDVIGRQAEKISRVDWQAYCADGNDCAKLTDPNGLWMEYQKLKRANKAINALFGVMLKFLHVYNIMQCAFFMMHLLDNNVTSMRFAFLLYNILRLSFAYYIAKQSHAYNELFHGWIRDWAMHSTDVVFLVKTTAMLDEVKSEPLGLGNGEFIIGETFILKFVGLVGSLVMLQVDNSKTE